MNLETEAKFDTHNFDDVWYYDNTRICIQNLVY